MKKTIQITTGQLQKIIKEGVARLHKQNLIENRINQINEELAEMGFGKQDSESTVVITIQVNGGWQETITIQPEDEDYYEVYHQFDNGKETRVNGGFHNMEDAVDWVKNEYLPNYNAHEIIDIEGSESINEVFYGDSDGDYDFDKSESSRAEELYDKGLELFNQGDTAGAEELRQQALKKGSWLGWGELEFPPYTNKVFDDMMGNPLDNMDFLGENSEVASSEILDVLNGYLEAALWTEEEEVGLANLSDISNNSKIDAYRDVKTFMEKAGSLLDGIEPSQVGHDLWLSRNGHGAGFFDRGLGDVGDTLQDIARGMGQKNVGWSQEGIVIE